MKTLVLIPLAACAISCTRHIPVSVAASHSDTTVERNFSADTIYIGDSVNISHIGDTIRETRLKTIYRTRTVCDTVTIRLTDTIPKIVEVEKPVKETSSHLANLRRYAIGALLSLLLLLALKRHGNFL